jgi:two-component system chemotaxis response regulator CheY
MSVSVLIVDDSTIARSVIRRAVAMSCPEVAAFHEAADGEEALRVLKKQPVDLVLTDLNMPNLNGVELVTRMRQDGVLMTVPVLLISSQRGPMVDTLVRRGLASCLPKPFRPEALREAVLGALAGRTHSGGRLSASSLVGRVNAERLAAVVMEVLDETAFILSRSTAKPPPYGGQPLTVASLPFRSYAISWLRLAATPSLARSVLGSLLDQVPTGESLGAAFEDALKEFVNLVAGRLAAELSLASDTPIAIGLPSTHTESADDWERELSTNPLSVSIVTDEGHRIDAVAE